MERNIIKIDEAGLKDDLKTLIRGTVEDTLNAMLDEEAANLCNAERHERSEVRKNYRSGHYHRKLLTGAGELDITVPKLRLAPFETAIIERYRRRESSVEESLIEMYLAGVSVRRVEYVTELLWGPRVSASTVSNLNQKVYGRIARDPRRGGRREREQGMQEIVLEKLEGARPGWRSAVYLGHAPGLPRVRIGGLLGRQVTTLHSTLLQERVHEGREGNADLPRVPP